MRLQQKRGISNHSTVGIQKADHKIYISIGKTNLESIKQISRLTFGSRWQVGIKGPTEATTAKTSTMDPLTMASASSMDTNLAQ